MEYYNSCNVLPLKIFFDIAESGNVKLLLITKKKLDQSILCDSEATIMGFWMNDEIRIGDISGYKNFDYIISKHKLDFPLIKSRGDFYIYKTNSLSSINSCILSPPVISSESRSFQKQAIL